MWPFRASVRRAETNERANTISCLRANLLLVSARSTRTSTLIQCSTCTCTVHPLVLLSRRAAPRHCTTPGERLRFGFGIGRDVTWGAEQSTSWPLRCADVLYLFYIVEYSSCTVVCVQCTVHMYMYVLCAACATRHDTSREIFIIILLLEDPSTSAITLLYSTHCSTFCMRLELLCFGIRINHLYTVMTNE